MARRQQLQSLPHECGGFLGFFIHYHSLHATPVQHPFVWCPCRSSDSPHALTASYARKLVTG